MRTRTLSAERARVMRDLALVAVSIALAIGATRTGAVHAVFAFADGFTHLGSFLAGALFTSIFTVAPSVALLAELAQNHSLLALAFWGGVGSAVGNLLMLGFIKDHIAQDIAFLVRRAGPRRLLALFKTHLPHPLLLFVGAFVLASPLPDEWGLLLLGSARMEERKFFVLSFLLHAAGIYAIGLAARSLS